MKPCMSLCNSFVTKYYHLQYISNTNTTSVTSEIEIPTIFCELQVKPTVMF